MKKYNIYFKLMTNEQPGDIEEDIIKGSHLFFILFEKIREDIKEKLDNDEILEEYIKIKDRREKAKDTIENLEKEKDNY